MPGLVFGSLRPPSLRMLTEIGSESTIWVRFTYSPEKVNLTPILRPDRLPFPAACSKKKPRNRGLLLACDRSSTITPPTSMIGHMSPRPQQPTHGGQMQSAAIGQLTFDVLGRGGQPHRSDFC